MSKAEALLLQLGENIKSDEKQRQELIGRIKGIVVFNLDGQEWTLDLREGKGSLTKGSPEDKADLTLTLSGQNFVSMVMGKSSSQMLFLQRKLKINGSMGLAMKLTPVLEAAAPRSKL